MNKNKNSDLRNSLQSLNKKSTQKGYSLHHLHFLNTKLQNQKQQRKRALQKMKQDKAISNKVDALVGEGFEKVENNGVYFASKLEQQRRKHKALTALVSHYQSLIYNQKLENHNQQMKTKQIKQVPNSNQNQNPAQSNSIYTTQKLKTQHQEIQQNLRQNRQNTYSSPSKNTQFLQQQIHHLRSLQSQFQQYILKNNTSQYQLSKKLDEVRTMRSQRTVLNKVFDQFQKQLFQHEFQYKKLVIERTILEHQFQNKVLSYENIAVKAQKQYEKMLKNKKKNGADKIFNTISIQRSGNLNSNHAELDLKQATQQHIDKKQMLNDLSTIRYTCTEDRENPNQDQQLRFSTSNQKKVIFRPQDMHNRSITQNSSQNNALTKRNQTARSQYRRQVNKQKNLQYQKKVKQIYQQLKILNYSQIPNILQNFQATIANLYKQQEQVSQKLYQKQKYYKNYQQFKNKNSHVNGHFNINTSDNSNSNMNINITQDINNQTKITPIIEQIFMQNYILKKQKIKNTIKQLQHNNQKIEKQLKQFATTQISKIKHLLSNSNNCRHASNFNFNFNLEINQNQLDTQTIVYKICELEQQFNKIVVNLPEIHSYQRQNQIDFNSQSVSYNSKKQTQNQEITRKQHEKQKESKRDTHKSVKLNQQANTETINIIPNTSYYKQKTHREKTLKTKPTDTKQSTQLPQKSSKLQQILQQNRTTHNTTSIYTQQQFMQISRRIINKQRQKHQIILLTNNYQQGINSSARSNKSNFFNKFLKQNKENKQNQSNSYFQ